MWIWNVRFEGRIAIIIFKTGGGWPPLSARGFQIIKNSYTGKRRQKHPVFVNTFWPNYIDLSGPGPSGVDWRFRAISRRFLWTFGSKDAYFGAESARLLAVWKWTNQISTKKKAWHLDHKGVTLFFGRRLVRSSSIWPKLYRKWHLSIRYSNVYQQKAWHLVVLTKTGCFCLLFPVHEFLRIWNPTVGVGGQPPPSLKISLFCPQI